MTAAVAARPPSGRRPWRYHARQAVWAGLDLIFPPACAGCDRPGGRLCAGCWAALARLEPPVCALCGYPAPAAGASGCAVCQARSAARGAPLTALAGLRSAAFFEGPLQHALHQLKYRRNIALADCLARELAAAWARWDLPAGWVVPVPLSAQRQRERGYNQTGLLARGFADLAGLPYLPAAAVRARHTATQVGLSAAERQANVSGAFAARAHLVAGRSLLLVDDVCTTGATLAACAEALVAAGAASVWGLTLGRARAGGAPARQQRDPA